MNEKYEEKFLNSLTSLHLKLQPIFSQYLALESSLQSKKSTMNMKNELINLLKNDCIVLISASSSKKRLKNLGIDPRIIIVTGGPLIPEDYRKINPEISDKAFEGIKSKCERIMDQLRNQHWENKNLIFISEKDNTTDNLILERIEELSNVIGKKIILHELNTWKEIE